MATANAARTLRINATHGTIEPGKSADFLLLTSEPGADVRNLGEIDSVNMKGEAGPSSSDGHQL